MLLFHFFRLISHLVLIPRKHLLRQQGCRSRVVRLRLRDCFRSSCCRDNRKDLTSNPNDTLNSIPIFRRFRVPSTNNSQVRHSRRLHSIISLSISEPTRFVHLVQCSSYDQTAARQAADPENGGVSSMNSLSVNLINARRPARSSTRCGLN